MIKRLFLFVLLTASVQQASVAQSPGTGLGTWNSMQVRYRFQPRWQLFGEAQLRSLLFYKNFHYYEYKGGVSYQLHPAVQIGVGIGDYDTYNRGGNFVVPKLNDEFRVWPQLILQHRISTLQLEHRYRWEMRYTSNGYRNRYRYRLQATHPVMRNSQNQVIAQVFGSSELFFTNRDPYFERIRSNIGVSYQVNPFMALQIGYLYQFDIGLDDEIGADFFQTAIIFQWGRKQKAGPITPSDN